MNPQTIYMRTYFREGKKGTGITCMLSLVVAFKNLSKYRRPKVYEKSLYNYQMENPV